MGIIALGTPESIVLVLGTFIVISILSVGAVLYRDGFLIHGDTIEKLQAYNDGHALGKYGEVPEDFAGPYDEPGSPARAAFECGYKEGLHLAIKD